MNSTDKAREYLIENLLPKFSDSTFQGYVKNELAGDFAYQLAMYLQSHTAKNDSNQSIEDVRSLVDASGVMLKWCVKNVHQWNFSEYDWLHSATEKVKHSLPKYQNGEIA